MLRASFAARLPLAALCLVGAGCDARAVDPYSTTQVIMRQSAALGACTQTQGLVVDLVEHHLSYSICTSSTAQSTVGTIALSNQEYPGLLSELEAINLGTSNQAVGGGGVYTADVYDGDEPRLYVEASTANGADSDRYSAKGVRDAYEAALAIVHTHLASGDPGLVPVNSVIAASEAEAAK